MNYKRNLSELNDIKTNGYKVFSCFSCGGGSTMGYKYAGYDVIGTCEIDKQMIKVYKENFNPKYTFEMGVQEMKLLPRDNLPKELFDIDILDGSPPCSTFSMAGSREKGWGKDKKFREGQAKQVLSDLFFDFLDLADLIKPKIIIAENVSGMLKGNAKGYVKMIAKRFDEIGYNLQIFLLNGATMGLPQKRERVFFIAYKKEYKFPKIQLQFNEKFIVFGNVREKTSNNNPSELRKYLLSKKIKGDKCISHINERLYKKVSGFNAPIVNDNNVTPTITSSEINYRGFDNMGFTNYDYCVCGSYPLDYNFQNVPPKYLIGMSVPPLMMYKISKEVKEQWLDKIYQL